MVRFDWLIALGLVSCRQLMMRFDWLIVLSLVRREGLMVQFDGSLLDCANCLIDPEREREIDRCYLIRSD